MSEKFLDQFSEHIEFNALNQALYDHVHIFLDENGTPIATGGINKGVDLIAIRNLSHNYDVAVPIARGGLNQGAIANLWEMTTRIIVWSLPTNWKTIYRGSSKIAETIS